MRWLRRLYNEFHQSRVVLGRQRVLAHLRDMKEARQRQLGYSPELIKQGVEAWPWRITESAEGKITVCDQPLSMTASNTESRSLAA